MQSISSLLNPSKTSTTSFKNNIPSLLFLVLLSSITITNTLASPINDDSSSDNDNVNNNNQQSLGNGDTRIVYVVIQNHGIHELTIPTNGDYAWDELSGIDIPDARILHDAPESGTALPSQSAETATSLGEKEGEDLRRQQQQQQRHTTCFFWRSRDDGTVPYAHRDAFVTQPIYSQGQSVASTSHGAGRSSMARGYRAAERIYCYDSTAEQTNRDVITVFMQNSQEEQTLVRLPVSAEERSFVLAMSEKPQPSDSSDSSSSSSSKMSVQDSSLKDFSDRGVTGMVLMYVPQRDSYCIADAGTRDMYALEFGIALKLQPGKKVFELDCRY